jgi:23S rRNA pseudouridine1911/1915/1917 synthase
MTEETSEGEKSTFCVTEDVGVGLRLDSWLVALRPEVNRSAIRRLIEKGHVTLNDAPPKKAGVKLRVGDTVTLVIPEDPLSKPPVAEDIPLDIIHVDADLAVVNKGPNMVVHPSKGHVTGTLVNGLLHHLKGLSGGGSHERPGIVHRLDMDTTGLLVVARNNKAHSLLQEQFSSRTIERSYITVVFGPKLEDEGLIRSLYGRHPRDRKRMSSKVEVGKEAITEWHVLARSTSMALLQVKLHTGRTHQIRAHLSENGHPVVADKLYGRNPVGGGPGRTAVEFAAARRMPRQALHAQSLGFTHPGTGEHVRFSSHLPEDMAALIETCFGQDVLESLSPTQS